MDLIIRIIADGLVIIVFLLAIYAFLFKVPKKLWWPWGWRIVAAGLTAYLLARLIGYFFQPESLRPFEKLGVQPGAAFLPNPGFPSDHMLFATFLTLAVWFSTKSRKLTTAMIILTVIMGVGRVLALVHTPLDVVGGFFIAALGAVWYYWPKPPK
ncbi:phosphatase PAP2 family protein [Candidatus Nomurabacteria bacterium]|nr:phosphatase PAP2 family protein [Candidatus Nomurabacteria bacterium]